MIIQYLNGGLANQVFQYIFARYIELASGGANQVLLDDSFFFINNVHNGYELEKVFGIRANLLSRQFDSDVWEELLNNKRNGISIAQSFLNMDVDIQMVAEASNYMEHNPFHGKVTSIECNKFYPDIYRLQGNIYFHGYWINKAWLNSFRKELLAELSFPALKEKSNLQYAEKMKNCDSVAVHIRRGDYVSLNISIGRDYYFQSVENIIKTHPDAVLFVFSDDIPWCRDNAEALGLTLAKDVVYVEGNMGGSNYIDMQLMTLCKGMILSNSAFCYLAALMSDSLKYYINPVPFREI